MGNVPNVAHCESAAWWVERELTAVGRCDRQPVVCKQRQTQSVSAWANNNMDITADSSSVDEGTTYLFILSIYGHVQ